MNSFHTHTFRCRHASGDIGEYVDEAIRKGCTAIGFSDHTPLPDNRWKSVRMRMEELPGYCQSIDAARLRFPGISILKGLECEYAPEYRQFYQEISEQYDIEYLVCGAHFFPYNGEWKGAYGDLNEAKTLAAYTNYLVDSISSGLFAFAAHPDLFANSYPAWDENTIAASRDILAAAKGCSVPLEINCYGLRKEKVKTTNGERYPYPIREFWEIAAEYGSPVMVNADAHRPQDVIADMDRGMELAAACGLVVMDSFLKG
jgi:histidinol-phosphatase (PHP family)